MSPHLPPFQWLDPLYEHDVSGEPDKVDATTRLLYDHLAGRIGSEARVSLSGASNDTQLTHRTVSTLIVTEPQVGRIAVHNRGYIGVKLKCVKADFHVHTQTEEFGSEFEATLTSEVTVLIFPAQPNREARVHIGPQFKSGRPQLYAVSSTTGGRKKQVDTIDVKAAAPDERRLVFEAKRIASWDQKEPLVFGVVLTNTVDVNAEDTTFNIDFWSEWIVAEVIVDTVMPYQVPEIKLPP